MKIDAFKRGELIRRLLIAPTKSEVGISI